VPVFNCMRLRDAIPGAGIKVVRDAGHMLPWEATEALASEIDAMVRRVEGGDA